MADQRLCMKWSADGDLIDGLNCNLWIESSANMGRVNCGDCLAGSVSVLRKRPELDIGAQSAFVKGIKKMKNDIQKIIKARARFHDGA